MKKITYKTLSGDFIKHLNSSKRIKKTFIEEYLIQIDIKNVLETVSKNNDDYWKGFLNCDVDNELKKIKIKNKKRKHTYFDFYQGIYQIYSKLTRHIPQSSQKRLNYPIECYTYKSDCDDIPDNLDRYNYGMYLNY